LQGGDYFCHRFGLPTPFIAIEKIKMLVFSIIINMAVVGDFMTIYLLRKDDRLRIGSSFRSWLLYISK